LIDIGLIDISDGGSRRKELRRGARETFRRSRYRIDDGGGTFALAWRVM
jgi:hypothetical protein